MKRINIKYIIISSILICTQLSFAEEIQPPQEIVKRSVFNAIQTYSHIIHPSDLSTAGQTIASRGTYILQNHAMLASGEITSGSEKCIIQISQNNVVLDLNEFTLSTSVAGVTAIIIETGVDHVTIKNGTIGTATGSTNLVGAILCRNNCTHITLENIVVEKVVAGDPIKFLGTSGNEIEVVTLKNVTSNHHSGATPTALSFAYTSSIIMENIHLNHNVPTVTFNACSLTNVNGAILKNVNIQGNSTASDANVTGIYYQDCYNFSIQNMNIINTTNTGTPSSSNCSVYGIQASNSATNNGDINFNQCNITGNSSTNGYFFGCYAYKTPHLSMKDITINNNSAAANDCNGMFLSTSKNMRLSNIEITGNSGANVNSKQTRGIYVVDCSSSKFNEITVTENEQGVSVQGIIVISSDNCMLENCVTNRNIASSVTITQAGRTAGILLQDSSYTTVTNCESSQNIGGKVDLSSGGAGTNTAAFSTALIGAGFVDYASNSSVPNKNNLFINCTARGNKTAWTGAPANPNTGSGSEQWKSYAQVAGFYLFDVTGTGISNCVAEQNGSANEILGYGIYMNGNTSNVQLYNNKAANNNWHGVSSDASSLSTLARDNVTFNNGISTIAQTVFPSSNSDNLVSLNFYFPNSSNVPFVRSAITDFRTVFPKRPGDNIIYHTA